MNDPGYIFSAAFSIFSGAAILVIWIYFYAAGKLKSIFEERHEMISHIAAEIIVAVLLILAGTSYFLQLSGYRILLGIALGGLLYATVNAAGFYLDRSQKILSLVLVLSSAITGIALLLIFL